MMNKNTTTQLQEQRSHSVKSFPVMIVDDDNEFSVELSLALKERGIDCLVVSSAEEALRTIKNNPEIAVVISDIILPKMSGLELLKRLRLASDSSPVHAIIVTGYASIDYAVSALRGNAIDFLQKPIIFEVSV